MGAALGLIGPLASIGGALFGMGQTANNVPQAPPVYQPTGQAAADQGIQSGIAGQQAAVPQANQAVQNLFNNPGAAGAQAGAQVAGGLGEAAGMSQFMQGQNLTNTGNSVVPYASMALNQGFDPLNSVYNQNFQQNTDQTRALLEQRGIDNTPYGAGVESQSNINFNNNWQNNLLNRETQGATTANTLFGAQNQDVTAGQNLSGQAPGTFMGGASMPYNINQTIGMNQLGALGQGQQIQQTPINNWMNYMQLGQGAAGVGTQQQQTNLNQNQLGFNQTMQLGNALGQGISGLGKAFNGMPSGGGNTGAFGQANTGMPGSGFAGPVAF